jgi:hypothetical protein
MFDQSNAQVRIILAGVVFAEADDIGLVPGRQNSLDDYLQSSFRCFVRLDRRGPALSDTIVQIVL